MGIERNVLSLNDEEVKVIDSGYNYTYRIYQPKYRYDKTHQGFDYTTKGEIN